MKYNHRVNYYIKVPEVRVITEDGKMLGILKTQDALYKAKNMGVDLVEISPKANPPVCKLIDYGKLKYQEEKQLVKPKVAKTKEVAFHINISDHDYLTKINHIKKFIEQKHQVRISVEIRKRESNHQDLCKLFIDKLKQDIQQFSNCDKINNVNNKITLNLTPIKK